MQSRNEPLDALAARACREPYFLASTMAAYQQRHGLDDAAVAAVLGCAPAVLTDLRLCRRPGAAARRRPADEDVAAIAQRYGLDAAALRRIADEVNPPVDPATGKATT
jgi:hypothetical protein